MVRVTILCMVRDYAIVSLSLCIVRGNILCIVRDYIHKSFSHY